MSESKAQPIESENARGPQPDEERNRLAQPVDAEQPPRLGFPVVGMGASAGGLEAFTEFFKTMPPGSGLAFVLIQHLPPERESMMSEILSKRTAMSVRQIEDGMPVEANHVYVIRPGHTLTIKDGKLRLASRSESPVATTRSTTFSARSPKSSASHRWRTGGPESRLTPARGATTGSP